MSTQAVYHPGATRPAPRPLSLRKNFAWTFFGNVGHAACQVGVLWVLARWATPETVGQFTLGIAVVTPIFTFTNLGLRPVQATDSRGKYEFGEYLGVRLLAILFGVTAVLATAIGTGYRQTTLAVIVVLGAAKVFESLSDLFYGLFQQAERMDWIGKSKSLQGLLAVATLTAGVWLTGNVIAAAVVGILLSWVIVLIAYDLPRGCLLLAAKALEPAPSAWKRLCVLRPRWERAHLSAIVLLGLPIGGTALLGSLNKQIPRYFVALDPELGLKGLGIFGALATLMMAGTTVSGALNQASCPRLAKLYAAGRLKDFRRLFGKLLVLYVVAGVAGVVLVATVGRQLVEFCFGQEYAEQTALLVWMMLAAGTTYIGALLDTGLIAVRCLRPLVPLTCVTIAVAVAGCLWLIPRYGLPGAGAALAVSRAPSVIVALALLWHLTWHETDHQNLQNPTQSTLTNQ